MRGYATTSSREVKKSRDSTLRSCSLRASEWPADFMYHLATRENIEPGYFRFRAVPIQARESFISVWCVLQSDERVPRVSSEIRAKNATAEYVLSIVRTSFLRFDPTWPLGENCAALSRKRETWKKLRQCLIGGSGSSRVGINTAGVNTFYFTQI